MHLVGERVGMPVAEAAAGPSAWPWPPPYGTPAACSPPGDRIVVEGGRAVGVGLAPARSTGRWRGWCCGRPRRVGGLGGPGRRLGPGHEQGRLGRVLWAAGRPADPELGQQSLADPSRARPPSTPVGSTQVPTRPIGDALEPEARTDWACSGELFGDRVEVASRPTPWVRRAGLGPPGLDAGRPGGGERRPGRGRQQRRVVRHRPAAAVPPGTGLVALGHPGQGAVAGRASVPPGSMAAAAPWPPGRSWPTSTEQLP
jgi:hypothetical protein